jgi:hypothetical protein
MILVMKNNSINQKSYIEILNTSILRFLKKKTCKNITPTFKYLNCFLKFPQILSLIQVIESSLWKHDYNNLAFEVHANKNLKYTQK